LGVPVDKISEDESAALGAALQAAWCVGGGSISRLAGSVVSMDESTRCTPGRKR
jgi:hypothetical protein